nr:reverse transcriptase domain-containing protein [Tanacetum cinerariifolium]
MSTRSTSSNLFSSLRDPESLIRRRNLGEPSSLFDFEEVMSISQGHPPPNNNGPPPVVRPNRPAPRSMEELCQPFADALLYIPKFASTFKSLLSNREKLFELENTPLTENCSAVLLKKLLEKLRDPGRFLIPCDFQGLESCIALADLGASINLMPLSVWKKLSLPDLTPTRRPFLRTAPALVDVHGEEIVLRDGDEKLIFHADSTSKHPHKHGNESINMINFIDITCEDHFPKILKTLNFCLNQDPLTEYDIETIDPILEKFTDEPALDYLPPLGDDDDDDDDLFDLKSDNDEWKKLLYGDRYKDIDSEKDKNKESKMKLLVFEAQIVESNDLLPQLLNSDSTLLEESSESYEIATLSSFPFRNEDKVFNPDIHILGVTQIVKDESKDKDLRDKDLGILISNGVHYITLELSHQTYETFKIINIHPNIFNKGPMKIFPFISFCPMDKGIR